MDKKRTDQRQGDRRQKKNIFDERWRPCDIFETVFFFTIYYFFPTSPTPLELAMSGISLSPKRALAYPGTRLAFVDESSVAYCFGSAVRITHLLPDKVTHVFRVIGRVCVRSYSRVSFHITTSTRIHIHKTAAAVVLSTLSLCTRHLWLTLSTQPEVVQVPQSSVHVNALHRFSGSCFCAKHDGDRVRVSSWWARSTAGRVLVIGHHPV